MTTPQKTITETYFQSDSVDGYAIIDPSKLNLSLADIVNLDTSLYPVFSSQSWIVGTRSPLETAIAKKIGKFISTDPNNSQGNMTPLLYYWVGTGSIAITYRISDKLTKEELEEIKKLASGTYNYNDYYFKQYPVIQSGNMAGYAIVPTVVYAKPGGLVNPDPAKIPTIPPTKKERESAYIADKQSYKILDEKLSNGVEGFQYNIYYYVGKGQTVNCRYGWYSPPPPPPPKPQPISLGKVPGGVKPPVYFITRFIKANKYGYARISETKNYPHDKLFRIGDNTYRDDITEIIAFPPSFKGDLYQLQNLHFYSPNDSCYYYYMNGKDLEVCYYPAQYNERIRKLNKNDCGYIVVTETTQYKHSELMGINDMAIDPHRFPIYSEQAKTIFAELPPGVTFPPRPEPPPTPPADNKINIGPLTINLSQKTVGFSNAIAGSDVTIGDATYQQLQEEYEEKWRIWRKQVAAMQSKYAKTVTAKPSCKKISSKHEIYAYQPAGKYQGRHFYCPANHTFYFYVKDWPDPIFARYLSKPKKSYTELPEDW